MNKSVKIVSAKEQREVTKPQNGSIELVVLGLLAALVVVLAFPLFIDSPESSRQQQTQETLPAENQ